MENVEKIRKERIKNIVHLVRLSPEKDQDEMVDRFTKGEPPEFVEAVKIELSRFEMEFTKEIHPPDVSTGSDGIMKSFTIDNGDEDGIYVRISSLDNTKVHKDFEKLMNKRIKVIIRELKN